MCRGLLLVSMLLLFACGGASDDGPTPLQDGPVQALITPVTTTLRPEVVQAVPQEHQVVPVTSSGSPRQAVQPSGRLPDDGSARSGVQGILLLAAAGGLLLVALFLSLLGRRKRQD